MDIQISSALRHLKVRENLLSLSLERLSSGLRVNRASDDAVSISISSRLRYQLSAISTSIDNLNDGISILRTIDGALSKIGSLLVRARNLSLKLNEDTNTELDRETYREEIKQSLLEIEDIVKTTRYNNKPLLAAPSKVLYIEGKEYIEDFYISSSLPAGTYTMSILSAGKMSEVALPLRTIQDISPSTSLYSALGESVSDGYIKTIYITSDGKTVGVPLTISSVNGDTVSSAVDKINNALRENDLSIVAYYDSEGKQIVLSSTEAGTRYAIDISEVNSIEGARYFSSISEVTSLEGPEGLFTYRKLTYIEGYRKGPGVTGGTLLRDYFNCTGPVTFEFTGFGGRSVSFSISSTYTLDYASLLIKNQLRNELGIDVGVTFNSTIDRFVFTYSNPAERLEVSITGGVHSEGYEIIEAREDTQLGNILDLQGSLSLTFLDETGPVATLILNESSTIGDIINAINNLNIGILASYSDGKINIDQSNRVNKIFEVVQEGSAVFSIGKETVNTGYPVLSPPEDIIFSFNDKVYTSNCREFRLEGISFTLKKEALSLLPLIRFQITPEPFIISLGRERITFALPDVSLSSLGLDNLNLSDTDLLLSKIEVAVDKVSGERSRIGGLENIFRDILLTQDIYKQNLEETDARLLLTDIIQEVSNLGREKALLLLGTSLIGEMSNILREIKLAGYNIGR